MRQVVPPIMKASHISHTKHFWFLLLGSLVLFTLAAPALAEQVSREQDIVNLRLGQRILVDDGSITGWTTATSWVCCSSAVTTG